MKLVKNAACKAVSPEGLCQAKILILKLNPTVTATGTESPKACADADPIATATDSTHALNVAWGTEWLGSFVRLTFRYKSYMHRGRKTALTYRIMCIQWRLISLSLQP